MRLERRRERKIREQERERTVGQARRSDERDWERIPREREGGRGRGWEDMSEVGDR